MNYDALRFCYLFRFYCRILKFPVLCAVVIFLGTTGAAPKSSESSLFDSTALTILLITLLAVCIVIIIVLVFCLRMRTKTKTGVDLIYLYNWGSQPQYPVYTLRAIGTKIWKKNALEADHINFMLTL